MNDFRVIVTGSQTWQDESLIRVALSAMVVTARAAGLRLVLVHGDCPRGADFIANHVARELGVPDECIEKHPPNWDHGRQAGMARNAEMVYAGADMCLAFIDRCARKGCSAMKPHGSHGSTQCANLAHERGITVRRFGFVPAGS